MRQFYVYGFKSRDEYTLKSARSYDDERRRLESWLGDYMGFRQTGEGKNAAKPICILCDGTTFFKTYKVRERVYGYLDEVLTRQLGIYWNIVSCDNDITLGAAISGLID